MVENWKSIKSDPCVFMNSADSEVFSNANGNLQSVCCDLSIDLLAGMEF